MNADPGAVAVSGGAEDHPTTTPPPTPTTVVPAPPQPTSPSTPSTSPPQPTTTTTTGVDDTGVAVPPGVPEQFTYFEMGDPPCSGPFEDSGPAIVANRSDTAWVLELVDLCLPGFDRFAAVEVTVLRPDGQVIALSYDPPSLGLPPEAVRVAAVSIVIDVDAPTGSYEVIAHQGTTVAQGQLSVVEPRFPQLRVVSSGAAHEFTVWMAGLAPGQPANIDLYSNTEPGTGIYHYAGTTEVPPSDARGRAVYKFEGSILDTGGYCLVARGGGFGCPFEGSY
jgi:hypothetical protein